MGKYYKRNYDKPRTEEKAEPIRESADDCVTDTVRRIIKAQDEVIEDCCVSSCESAIKQLRKRKSDLAPQHTTIPFILYCNSSCSPFIGSGVFQAPMGNCKRNNNFFGSVETPIFRAKSFAKDSDNCVKLELLLPVTEQCEVLMPALDGCKCGSISQFFPTDDPVTGFQATGICITVNLNHFLAVTCLDPITPIPADADRSSHHSQRA
ncbi:hypothetical protein CIL03_07880 [Virgibacillus indicus]|uniref:Spore coat protein n=1 Tax=Virgibacillus indicus TaxID=2024554 RepID=A0A265NA75_9BACI|nr:CotY/CotZ family spore coat protein [Virgibacillus indicus]OZU88932.1 hypothetical protein CIL03_07880 [Virgibacillus indicus]